MNIEEISLPNPGIFKSTLPNTIFDNIKEEITIQTTFKNKLHKKMSAANTNLAGCIEEEFIFNMPKDLENYLNILAKEYASRYNLSDATDIVRHSSWINRQKATEYNPLHNHSGDISWVMWTTIPYLLSDEDKIPNTKFAQRKFNSRFNFVYSKLNGQISQHTLDIDSSWEGKIIMFPNYLLHYVNPFFTSDNFRISIAGNIWLGKK